MPDNRKDERQQNVTRPNLLSKRAALGADERERASATITRTVTGANYFRRARLIGCYLATPSEVDTAEIILRAWRMKKRVFAPIVVNNNKLKFREVSANCDVVRNRFGILEPSSGEFISPHRLDLVFTPGVAFDHCGHRIGMGSGYYDRTFSFLRSRHSFYKPKLIGLAFECQIVDEITANPWDIRVFRTVTDTK
jgi:5-formyltetrahydrofolate cyclo-ligase